MKLKRIQIKNYKNLKNFDQVLDGNVFLVKGDNEKGKTTFARAFLKLITKVDKPEIPVTEGAEDGFIKGQFKDAQDRIWTVTYEFTNKKDKLTLISPDGITTTKVTEIRDLFNYFHVDVDEFISWSSTAEGRRNQRDVVLNMLPEVTKAKFQELEVKERTTYNKRADASALHNSSNTFLEEQLLNEEDQEILEEYHERKLNVKKLQKAKEVNSESKLNKENYQSLIDSNEREVSRLTEKITDSKKDTKIECDELYDEVKEMESKILFKNNKIRDLQHQSTLDIGLAESGVKVCVDDIDDLEKSINKLVIISSDQLIDDLTVAQGKLSIVESLKSREENVKATEDKVKEHFDKAENLTRDLEEIRITKKKIITDSDIPIKGLEITADEILLNRLPFTKEQLSTSEIMTTVFQIMVTLNKKTPIFHVGRAESLGKEKLNELILLAKKNDYQVFFDKMESDSELKIEIIENHG